MKFLLGNNFLNDSCLDTLCFFGLQVLFVQSFFSVWVKELKYFCLTEVAFLIIFCFWDVLWNSFQLLLLLLIGEQRLIWGFHLDYFLILNFHIFSGFLNIVLVATSFKAECPGVINIFLNLNNFVICSCSLSNFLFFLNVWQACHFFYTSMLPLSLFLTDINSISKGKKWLFIERYFFLERHVHSKNKQFLLPGFLNRLFWYFWNPQEASSWSKMVYQVTF